MDSSHSVLESFAREHRLIAGVVDAFAAFAESWNRDDDPARCQLLRLVTFFREYADLFHHEKEENILIPALVDAGVPWDRGALEEIRRQHDFERYLLQSLRHAALQQSPWSSADRQRILDLIQRFLTFMRGHLALEDREFSVMIARVAPEAASELADRLERFDAQLESSGELSSLRELAAQLISAGCEGASSAVGVPSSGK